MRKNRNLAWMSAIALTSAMSFTACSSDDDTMQNVNPSYDGNSVKTQFAINVPKAAKTRQTAEITQNGGVFRGMEGITLVPMTATPTDATPGNAAQDIITLADYSAFESGSTNYKLYNDVEINVGVSHFLFYGQALGTASAATITDKHANGVLVKDIKADNSQTTIKLQQIHTSPFGDITDETDDAKTLVDYLNGILGANANWKSDAGSTTTHMGILHKSFTSLTAGSANAILKTIEKLYNGVAPVAESSATDDDTPAKIAYDIKKYIDDNFTVTSTTTNGLLTHTVAYKTTMTFPTNLGLPEGAARVTYASNAFSYVATAMGTGNTINVDKICYPASLNYFASTAIKVTNAEVEFWPSTAATWGSYAWTGWTDEVHPTTRTIALKDNINYGVALLKTTVKADASLADNFQSLGGALADKTFTNTNASENFRLTGVLVGGQPNGAKWNFLPANGATFDQTIWDCTMNETPIKVNTNVSTANYTMVLDNTAAEKQKVNIAVELENNTGEEFYGIDGVVPAGGKFYLVAQLDPASGTGSSVDRVFLKDYTTTANLTVKNLKKAYVNIPDLRSTKLELGLSVDLEWQAGLTFNVEIQ